MEPSEVKQPLATPSASVNDARSIETSSARPAGSTLSPPAAVATAGSGPRAASNPQTLATVSPDPCSGCVYALGSIDLRFPSLSVEKEFAQATGRAETAALSDRQALQKVLSQRHNRYLARQLCWVLNIKGLETYVLKARDPVDFELLVEAVRPRPSPMDLDVVLGFRGAIAPPEWCNGLMVPILVFDQIYSFDRDSLIKSIPRPEKIPHEQFAAAAEELFDRIMQMTDNAGATDEDRALNYLAVRHPAIYGTAAEEFARNSALSAVDVQLSRLSGVRKIVEVVFSYTNRNTDVIDKFFVRVDVTGLFPFLVNKLSPYFDR